jgi:hypothetical protein
LTGGNVLTTGVISAAGIVTGGNVSTGNITAGNVSTTGNVQAAYFLGDGSQLTNLPAGNYSNANVANYLPTYTGNLVSLTGPVTTTANITGGNLRTAGSITATGNITGGNVATGNITAGNVGIAGTISATGNIAGAYILGDGSQLTNLPAGNYSNANVANYLPTYTGNLASLTGPVITTSNITGGNLQTGGSLTVSGNVTGGNVSTGNILAGNVSTVGNVRAAYFLGDGSQLTNLPAGNYSNANVANYLPTYTGNLASLTGPVNTTSNITGGNLVTTGSITATGNIAGGNIATGNLVAANVASLGTVSAVGNVAGTYFIGNGAFLTGIASGNSNYSNANVAAYLPTYTGNLVSLTGPVITTNNITGGNVSTLGNVTANNLIANNQLNIGLANIYPSNFNPAVLTIQADAVGFSGQIIATGNVSGNNLSAGGNVVGGNIRTAGIVSAAGNIYAANFVGNVTGNITVPGATTQILFNDGGLAGANAGLIFNKTTQILSVTGNIQSGNIRTVGLISATGNIAGQYFVGNGALLTGIIASAGAAITNGNSNVTVSGNGNVTVTVAGVNNVTTFASTGVYIAGVVSASGNITGGGVFTDNYYYANGSPVPQGIVYSASTAPPSSPPPKVTDQWYDTSNDVLYEFIDDGTSTYWVDTTSPAFAGGVVANVAISGTLVPIGNVTYDIGTSTVYFRNTYTQNLYTNNRLTASNMPSGAVVQTIMSTSLGGSATTGTSYSDIALANVVIQPSSANSKVLIIATGTSSFTPLATANLTASTQIVRTASSLQVQEYSANVAGGGAGGSSAVAFSYLDSPNTTSPVTYKLQQKISNSSSTLTSSNMWIIAMEIAVP